ncbi:MAG TPA: SRPBCC domain-containing protein [Bacteroidetes bacterium]|nr:SRPBCC domain-containing protein [Bacteroidota bacterium]
MSGTHVDVIPAVHITHTVPVARERVFKAWIDKQDLQKWFIPDEGYCVLFVEIDPRKHSKFRIALKDSQGNQHLFGGIYREFVMSERLDFTCEKNGGGTQQHKTFVSVQFFDNNGETKIELIHDNLSDEKMRDEYEKSWNLMLDRLESYLKS